MAEPSVSLTDLSEGQRVQAYTRFKIIRPVVEDGVSQAQIARTHDVPVSTIQRWVKRYREKGIVGLADAGRSDKGTSRRLSPDAIALVKKLALQTPLLPVATIHRQVTEIAKEQGWNPPSYARVRQIFVDAHTTNIARLAGVSTATVSRVLNQKPDVDPATRERILRIMEEQGFVPSITASGLASGRSRLIGVLVASFTWPLIPDIIHGVAEVVERSSYELVLYSINDSSRESDKWEMIDHILATKLTSGLLAIMPGQSSRHIARLHSYGFPVVIVDDEDPPASAPWVGVDNRGGAYAAVRHLLRLGHRRIAHIQGP